MIKRSIIGKTFKNIYSVNYDKEEYYRENTFKNIYSVNYDKKKYYRKNIKNIYNVNFDKEKYYWKKRLKQDIRVEIEGFAIFW